jgi:hypothetical protein
MTLRHDEIAAAILNVTEGGSRDVTLSDAEEIYAGVAKGLQGGAPIVTAVRIDRQVVLQFSERSTLRLNISFGKEMPKKSDFSSFIANLEYQDVTPKAERFLAQVWREVTANWLPLILGVAVLWLLMWQYGTSDGWTNLFGAAAQVVSIFTAVFMVFAAVQRPANRNLLYVFTSGRLDSFYFTDLFLVKLAICSIFTTLIGSFIAKYTDKWQPITASVASFSVAYTPYAILLWFIGTLLVAELVILFVSLPQYYFARGRRLLCNDMLQETLNKRYEDIQAELQGNVTPLRQLDRENR